VFTGGSIAPGVEEWRSEQGSLRVTLPGQGIFVTRVEGRALAGFVGVIIRLAEQEIAAGHRLLVFHDWELVRGYDPQAREKLVAWTQTIRDQWDASHILFSSAFVAMAVSISSLLFGEQVKSYSSRATWQRALDAACETRGTTLR
jgi:hypothetical protein